MHLQCSICGAIVEMPRASVTPAVQCPECKAMFRTDARSVRPSNGAGTVIDVVAEVISSEPDSGDAPGRAEEDGGVAVYDTPPEERPVYVRHEVIMSRNGGCGCSGCGCLLLTLLLLFLVLGCAASVAV